jgi:hypothetical protein
MASAIGSLVSNCFYEEKLKTGRKEPESFYAKLPKPLNNAQVIWLNISNKESQSYETEVKNQGYSNNYEVDVILKILEEPIF